jgi:16S rRNA G966 N2-methylase RsmD
LLESLLNKLIRFFSYINLLNFKIFALTCNFIEFLNWKLRRKIFRRMPQFSNSFHEYVNFARYGKSEKVIRDFWIYLNCSYGNIFLELCGGDGLSAALLFSRDAKNYTFVEVNPEAIKNAKKHFQTYRPEIKANFICKDVKSYEFNELYDINADVVIIDTAVLYFSKLELAQILRNMICAKKNNFTLIGTYPINVDHADHKCEYSIEDMKSLLNTYFKTVSVVRIMGSKNTVGFIAKNPS